MKVVSCGHFHCHICGAHCSEKKDVDLSPPDPRYRVFWCQNPNCPNFGRSFIHKGKVVELEEVRLEVVQ
jgi:hypothetical protein